MPRTQNNAFLPFTILPFHHFTILPFYHFTILPFYHFLQASLYPRKNSCVGIRDGANAK
jgi:hypothetical protein